MKKNYLVPISLKDRLVYLFIGSILLTLGASAAWMCYNWAVIAPIAEHQWAWIAGSGGLAFFMLRGAWFGFFPPRKEIKTDLLGSSAVIQS